MSKVEVLLPQNRLSCRVHRNIPQQMVNVDRIEEPSGDEVMSENDKQLGKVIFDPKRDSDACEGELDPHNPVRKRKHRRGKKRKWRPYCKLSWEEKRELEERNSRRAIRVRAEMSADGHTLAPYNTTQFLMDDHNLQEPDYDHIPNGHRHRDNSNSMDSSDEFYSSPEDEEDFLQKQFTLTYEDIHAEHLNSLTKIELVQEIMNMEDRIEMLQSRLDTVKRDRVETADSGSQTQDSVVLEEHLVKIDVFRNEIKKLSEENKRLQRENEYLRTSTP